MKLKIFSITFVFISLTGILIGQNSDILTNDLKVISSDSLALKKYNWTKCIVNKGDTIIVLSYKNLDYNCLNESTINLKKINSLSDGIGYRFNNYDIYVDETLLFPKEVGVYLLKCAKE